MLQIFRDKSQSTFIQAIVLVIALVFVFWGVGANMMDSREAAIVVNDEDISFQEYQRAYDQMLASYRQQFGGSVPEEFIKTLGLSQQIQSQLIQQALLRQGTQAMGIMVSGPEVQRAIQEMVQFQESGVFNMEKYKATLQSNSLTPHKFEASMRYDTLSTKGVQAIGSFATTVTDAEINDLYQQGKESVTLQFAALIPETFVEQVTIEEAALATWFENNKERYKTAPQIRLKFLSFAYSDDTDGPKSAVFTKANEAYEGIIAAGSLQAYAETNPDITIRETDYFPRTKPPEELDNSPAILDKAFSLKVGELSSLLESPNGYSILFAESIQPPIIPELTAVREEAEAAYREDEAKVLAKNKGEAYLLALQEGGDFAKLAQENQLTIKDATVTRMSTAEESNGFPQALLQDVFSLSTNQPLPEEPGRVGDTVYLYQFKKRTLPAITEITAEEKEQIRARVISNKQERLLVAWIRHQERDAEIYTNKNLK